MNTAIEIDTRFAIENELHTIAQWERRQLDQAIEDLARHERFAAEYEAAGDTARAARQRMLAEGAREDIASLQVRARQASIRYMNRVSENMRRSY